MCEKNSLIIWERRWLSPGCFPSFCTAKVLGAIFQGSRHDIRREGGKTGEDLMVRQKLPPYPPTLDETLLTYSKNSLDKPPYSTSSYLLLMKIIDSQKDLLEIVTCFRLSEGFSSLMKFHKRTSSAQFQEYIDMILVLEEAMKANHIRVGKGTVNLYLHCHL